MNLVSHFFHSKQYIEDEDTMTCHKLSVEEDGEVRRRGEHVTLLTEKAYKQQ